MRNKLPILIIIFLAGFPVFGQDWVVPPDKKEKLSPFAFSDQTRKNGQQLYTLNCMACHGTPQKGNVLKLVPPPADPASEEFQRNVDGEIFYKISEGRGLMPTFKNVLSSEQIWDIISFLRNFNKAYIQSVAQVITSMAYPGAEIKISLAYDSPDTLIILTAMAVKENVAVPVIDAGVRLYVQRTFGMLPVDEEKNTDEKGLAKFRLPDDLPADTAGNIKVTARFTNEDVFGMVSKDTLVNTGEKLVPVSLVAKRAFWNTVWKAPVWLLITYFTGLLVVWGIILYILLMLRDIYIIGDALATDLQEEKPDLK